LSEKSQLMLMAEYNQLMNQRIFEASSNLSDEILNEDKGAFFKSILMTLNHIMIGDILWLKRFSEHPGNYTSLKQINDFTQPERLDQILFNDLNLLYKERKKLDEIIIDFCNELKEEDISNPLNYTNFKKEIHCKNFGYLILHVFLHQIHHRGQVTTLLSQEGIDFGDTDIPEIVPDETGITNKVQEINIGD